MGRDLSRRLGRLEEHATPLVFPDWPIEDQVESVLQALKIHRSGGTEYLATDRELRIVDLLISEGYLPERAREYFERMDPDEQPARENRLYANWPAAKQRREYWRHYFSEEQVQARREESRQRDRELLERNRASVGLPPLTPEQITKWDLEGTWWGGGGR